MVEIRCPNCNRKLADIKKKSGEIEIEIKCPKCKLVNKYK